jgi:hypothetical protein
MLRIAVPDLFGLDALWYSIDNGHLTIFDTQQHGYLVDIVVFFS